MGENVKYYSITEAAKMLRVSRPTIYARINSGQMKAVRISERIVRIPESEFAAVEMRYEQTPQRIDTDKMISKEEAMAKYEIGQAYFYRKVKDNGIKAFRYGTKVYYDKSEIKKLFYKPMYDDSIVWISSQELSEQFGISSKRVCQLAHRYGIAIKRGRQENAQIDKEAWMKHRVEMPDLEKNYLTVDQAKKHYKIGQGRFYAEVNAHQIPKRKQGNFVYFLKSDLDPLFLPKKIPAEIKRTGMTGAEALKHYHIGQKRFTEETQAAGVTKIRTVGNYVYYNKEELDKLFNKK